MNCHNCEVSLNWDGVTPIVVCEICRAYRFVDLPDETANRIVSLKRAGSTNCPRCRRRMKDAAMDGLKVEHCADCQGVLLTDDVFAMFVRNRRPDFREAAQGFLVLVEDQLSTDVHCPCCRQPMDIHPCYGPDFLIIDTCVDCRLVWLDYRETVDEGRSCETASRDLSYC